MNICEHECAPRGDYAVNGSVRQTNVSLFRQYMLDSESSNLQHWLRLHNWKVAQTARCLGISREWLFSRIRFHKLRELEAGMTPIAQKNEQNRKA
jgi:transcriptional regulator of acetoin/glycerol metabolism